MSWVIETIITEFVRESTRGIIEGLLTRYDEKVLLWHLDHNTNLIEEGLRSPDPRDRAMVEWMQGMARKHVQYAAKLRDTIDLDFIMKWMWRRYPKYAVILDNPRGRAWIQKNLESGVAFLFPT